MLDRKEKKVGEQCCRGQSRVRDQVEGRKKTVAFHLPAWLAAVVRSENQRKD